jgi:CRP-like cAMP-binding protein
MSDILLDELRAKISLSEDEFSAYKGLFTPRHFKRREYIFKAGQCPGFVVFILKGCMRVYYSSGERAKHTIYFAEERWWTGDIAAMRSNTPTDQNLQALEECDVLIMTKENWEYAYNNFPWFAEFHITGHQRWLAKLNKQIGQLLLDSPEENYSRLLIERPALVHRLPNYYIAGYLGITPEQFAQVRKSVRAKNEIVSS